MKWAGIGDKSKTREVGPAEGPQGEGSAPRVEGRRPGTGAGAGAVGPVGRVLSLQSWARELLQGPRRRSRLGQESLRLWLLAAFLLALSGKLQSRGILRLREAWEAGRGLPVVCCPEVWWWWFSR